MKKSYPFKRFMASAGWSLTTIGSIAISPALGSPYSPVAQIQITDQPETAVDLILDALEEQPADAATFFLTSPTLTESQKLEIQAIYEKYEAGITAAKEGYLQSINLLNNLVTAETTNEAIAHVRAEVLALEDAVYDLLFDRAMEIRSVLTEPQRENFNRFLRSLLNLNTPIAVSTFPENLIGRQADQVLAQLLDEGWVVSVRTPRTILLDKEEQTLDLFLNDDYQVEDTLLIYQ